MAFRDGLKSLQKTVKTGIRQVVFGRRDRRTVERIINLLNQGYSLTLINRSLIDIPEVRTVINWIAEKVGMVPFFHMRGDERGSYKKVDSAVDYVLNVRPNPYQTPMVFRTLMVTMLLANNNTFAYPEWDSNGNLAAIYPLPFTQFTFGTGPDGRATITFQGSGGPLTLYYDDVLHYQRFPTMTGGQRRQATNSYTDVLGAMQEQAVNDSETAGRVQALLKVATPLKASDLLKKLNEFKDNFMTAENTTGFGMISGDYTLEKVDLKNNPLNVELMAKLLEAVNNYFGVSSKVIQGTALELEYEQAIDNGVKPIVTQMEQEDTYKLFSRTEIGHRNKIMAETVDLEISPLSAKTAFYKEMLWAVAMNRNEVRKRLRLPLGPPKLDEFPENKNFFTKPTNSGGDNNAGTGENATAQGVV